jgi:transposase
VAAHQKKARRQGRVLALTDESGFMLQPPARRTWAPKGKTPELICGARHDRVSVISSITVSPVARRVGFAFALQRTNCNTDTIERFVRDVQRSVRRPVTFVWDRLSAHRSVAKRLAGDCRFEFVLLPPYAPTLNPDEWVWRYAKHHLLANACPSDGAELERQVRTAMSAFKPRAPLLRSFFRGAKMSL